MITKMKMLFLKSFQRFNVSSNNAPSKVLQSVTTKDLATAEIQKSLLSARTLGKEQQQEFVEKRLLVSSENEKPTLPIQEPIKRNNALTFESLYDIVKDSKEKDKRVVMKADRNMLLHLITAYESGRQVDLANILKHELLPVPVSLAEMNGTIRTGNKSILAEILTTNIVCPENVDIHQSASLITDGQSLVVAIGKPAEATTFGDLADSFIRYFLQMGSCCDRIDVVFDRYQPDLIKRGTRRRRTKTCRPIRRVTENLDVPLPNN